MQTLIWVHEDALRKDHPAYRDCDLSQSAYFIWDDAYLEKMNYGLKRLIFIYETVCHLGIQVYRGDTQSVLKELAASTGAECLRLAATPNPDLNQIAENLAQSLTVHIEPDDAFVSLEREPSLKRFFGYWKKARPVLMHE